MLTPEQLGTLRALIDERRGALEAEVHLDAARSRDQPYGLLAGETTDVSDRATADLLSDLGNAELSRDVDELRALEAAQERLDSGSYGSCLDCGGDIAFERLLAQPASMRCVECQRRHEKTYAHSPEPKL